jgi:hypothetical protein
MVSLPFRFSLGGFRESSLAVKMHALSVPMPGALCLKTRQLFPSLCTANAPDLWESPGLAGTAMG